MPKKILPIFYTYMMYPESDFPISSICKEIKKKKKKSINFKTNYRREMKLALINMDYYLLQFDSLKLFLGVRLHGKSLPNFNFFKLNLQIFQRNH